MQIRLNNLKKALEKNKNKLNKFDSEICRHNVYLQNGYLENFVLKLVWSKLILFLDKF